MSSRAPMGLWAHIWAAHLSWLDTVDGYSSWCSICHDGGDVLLCDVNGCKAVQHAACLMQSDARAQQWRCDDCWLLAGERPPAREGGAVKGAGVQNQPQSSRHIFKAKRRRTGTAGRQGWLVGAWVMNACGVEHIIRAMRHGYVQYVQSTGLY